MSLFQSKAWQRAWWSEWGRHPGFSLVSEAEQGACGLYLDRYRFKGILPVCCLQFMGTNYRRVSTPRSEYNSFGSFGEHPAKNDMTPFDKVMETRWTEAVFRDMLEGSEELAQLYKLASSSGWSWRVVARDTAYSIDTRGSFEDYLAGLGKNSRLKIFNRRKVLESLGDIQVTNAWPGSPGNFFEKLNGFHRIRWGSNCFNGNSLNFHRTVLSNIGKEGGQPELSVLSCDGRPISVLYNVLFQGRVYNLQAGFEEDFHKKLALGTLHLGYCIEKAFGTPEVNTFDLLAGAGKHDNYKVHLTTHSESLISIMVVRSRFFQLLYRLKSF